MKIMAGAFFSASSKAFLRLLSDSPASLLIISGPFIRKKKAPVSFATARAINVLPVPGGPYSKMPLGGWNTTTYLADNNCYTTAAIHFCTLPRSVFCNYKLSRPNTEHSTTLTALYLCPHNIWHLSMLTFADWLSTQPGSFIKYTQSSCVLFKNSQTRVTTLFQQWFSMTFPWTKKWISMTYRHSIFFPNKRYTIYECLPE